MNKVVLLDIEFHFGIGFLTELFENTGTTLTDVLEKVQSGDITIYRYLMYYSRLYSVKRKGQTPDFDFYSIDDLIDSNGGIDGDFIIDFAKAFFESINKNVPVDENKKKVKQPKK